MNRLPSQKVSRDDATEVADWSRSYSSRRCGVPSENPLASQTRCVSTYEGEKEWLAPKVREGAENPLWDKGSVPDRTDIYSTTLPHVTQKGMCITNIFFFD